MNLIILILTLHSQLFALAHVTKFLSHSICKIIENFYISYSNNIDIIDFDGTQGELINDIVERIENSITV